MIDFLSKYIKFILSILTLLGAISTGIFWVDTRYMHKSMATMQYTELQLIVYTRELKLYEQKMDNELHPTAQEKREYDILLETVKDLTDRRNKALGLK